MDYLLKNCDFVLTWINDELRILRNADIAISDGLIMNVGTITEVGLRRLIVQVMS